MTNPIKSYARSCRTDIVTYIESFPTDDRVLGYICGFIAADGNLVTGSKCIRIEIKAIDQSVLDWIAYNVVANPPVLKKLVREKEGKIFTTVRFGANLPRLYDFCLSIGITPSKSLTLDVDLSGTSEIFKWYFMRGILDGDGCIYEGHTLGECSIRLTTASRALAEGMQSIFGGQIVKGGSRGNGCWFLLFKGNKAVQLATHLPTDYFCLQRKTVLIEAIQLKTSNIHRRDSILVGQIWN